jgi:hypothetical protein
MSKSVQHSAVPALYEGPTIHGMRIIKNGACSSLSGLSEITYQIGYPVDATDVSAVCFKISGNSSSGKWNPNWISIASIERTLAKIPPEQSFTAAAFNPLYVGGSANSGGFLGSILLALGLIARVPNGRSYVRDSGEMFWADIEKALAGGVSLVPSSMEHSAGDNSIDTTKAKPGKKSKSLAETSNA